MAPKAPRIPEPIWERYRDEITALYFAHKGTLKKMMQTMKERHGFQATKNQYTTKLKAWGLEKYANTNIWVFVDYKQRKRKLEEGKDTEFEIRGRKRSRSDVEKEIARNVTHTSRLQLWEDIPTPEGVQVFTPGAEVSSVALREVYIDNLAWFQLQRDIQALMLRIMNNKTPQSLPMFNMLDQPRSQLSILQSPQSVAKLLQMALGDAVEVINPDGGLASLRFGSKNELPHLIFHDSFFREEVSLASYFPPSDTNNNVMSSLSTFDIPNMPSRLVALQGFIQCFVFLTNNSILDRSHIFKSVDWLLKNIDPSLFSCLFNLKTTTVKIFMRKIFPAVVNSGNTKVAKDIIDRKIDRTSHPNALRVTHFDRKIDMTSYPNAFRATPFHASPEECMSIAFGNGDNEMVELLCKAGFPTRINQLYIMGTGNLPWNTGNLEVLQTLLSFGADPECFIEEKERGFPLVDAANSGSLEAVDMLLKAKSRVNVYVPSHFGTPLQAAICAENLEIAELLIEHGADLNAPCGTQYHMQPRGLKTFYGHWKMSESEEVAFKTPIEIACEKSNIPLVEMLLAHGALVDLSPVSQIDGSETLMSTTRRPIYNDPVEYSPNYGAFRFHTALQYSVQNRNIFLVRLLLSQGANPNSRVNPNWGDTPLQISARLDYPEITQVLMDNGADVNAPPGMVNGRTAIQAAAESGNIQIAQKLLSRNADINAPAGPKRGLTALQAAVQNGHPLMVGFLWMSGADLNAPPAPSGGLTAIQAAAGIGDLNLIRDLTRQGADVNGAAAEYGGRTAIEAALSHKNLSMLKFLVKHGADVNGSPSIVAAAENSWVDGVRCLLENGANVNSSYYNVCEEDYVSPLRWSIVNDDFEMMKLLLESGADLHFPSSIWDTQDALCFALRQGCFSELIFLLLEKYAGSGRISFDQNVLAAAVEYSSKNNVMFGIILNAISELPKTLYEAQVRNAWNELAQNLQDMDEDVAIENIKLQLKAGAEINSKLNSEHIFKHVTLLQVAVRIGKISVARHLLEEGAEIQVPAIHDTGTPLQETIRHHDVEFAYLLLEHGADVNASPAAEGGVTALQAAAGNGYRDLAVDLLQRGADVNAPPAENRGVTALQAAAINGHMDVAVELLRRGAHVAAAAAPSNGRTAIDGAAERGLENMLQLLLNHYDGYEDLRVVCEVAATFAEREGHVEIARWLRQYPNVL